MKKALFTISILSLVFAIGCGKGPKAKVDPDPTPNPKPTGTPTPKPAQAVEMAYLNVTAYYDSSTVSLAGKFRGIKVNDEDLKKDPDFLKVGETISLDNGAEASLEIDIVAGVDKGEAAVVFKPGADKMLSAKAEKKLNSEKSYHPISVKISMANSKVNHDFTMEDTFALPAVGLLFPKDAQDIKGQPLSSLVINKAKRVSIAKVLRESSSQDEKAVKLDDLGCFLDLKIEDKHYFIELGADTDVDTSKVKKEQVEALPEGKKGTGDVVCYAHKWFETAKKKQVHVHGSVVTSFGSVEITKS